MCLAQHLAVFYICAAALAPCGHMVGIHFFQFPNAAGILVVANGAVGAIANALGLCLIGLLLIHFAHGWLVEQTDIQELCILTATKHILKHASKSSCINSRTFCDSSVWFNGSEWKRS